MAGGALSTLWVLEGAEITYNATDWNESDSSLHQGINSDEYEDAKFGEMFRLEKPEEDRLVGRIQHGIMHVSQRNMALTPYQQVQITLRFHAAGSFFVCLLGL